MTFCAGCSLEMLSNCELTSAWATVFAVSSDRILDVPKSPDVEISGAADFIYMFIQGHVSVKDNAE